MRVYELIGKALEFAGVASPFDAGENTASLLALKHPGKIKLVAIAGAIASVLGQHRLVIMFIGFGAIRIKDRHPVPPLRGTNRDPTPFVERVYPLVNILTMFLAWGVSHA